MCNFPYHLTFFFLHTFFLHTSINSSFSHSNTLSRLFVSMHRIGQSAQIHEKFQRHIMASLLSNFQLTVFEMVLLNPSLATNETGLLIEEKLEKLIRWFSTNTTYEPTIKRYSILAQGLSSALLDETCESIACFTKDEFVALRSSQKGNPSSAETVQKLIDVRRNYVMVFEKRKKRKSTFFLKNLH